jgi:NTP pyrophosphatase (non-canonical NTP hydrolase)
MKFKEYQDKAKETAIYPRTDWDSGVYYTALGLTSEAGEVAGAVKKVLRDNSGIFTADRKDVIGKELGDVLWYVASLASELGLDLDKIAEENIQKLNLRKQNNKLSGSGDNR